MMTTRLVGTLIAALLLAGCGTGSGPAASPSPSAAGGDVAGTAWLLEGLDGQAPVAGTYVSAQFGADGALTGSGGCNRYRAGYTVSGGDLRITGTPASTMMACEPAVMAQEQAFFAALPNVSTFAVRGDRLTLSDAAGKDLLTFTAQAQGLAGTSWRVTAYNNGQEAVVNVLEETALTMTFAAEGTVSGSAGCNTFSGPYTAEGGKVTLGPLAATMRACLEPGVMAQEKAFLAALESAGTYRIEGPQLEMRTAKDALAVMVTRA